MDDPRPVPRVAQPADRFSLRLSVAARARRDAARQSAHPRRSAPSGTVARRRYGIESKFTQAARDLAGRFKDRIFLSATPHNGHSNSLSTLLELLDPYPFSRGVKVRRRKAREDVMVRRLEENIRRDAGGVSGAVRRTRGHRRVAGGRAGAGAVAPAQRVTAPPARNGTPTRPARPRPRPACSWSNSSKGSSRRWRRSRAVWRSIGGPSIVTGNRGRPTTRPGRIPIRPPLRDRRANWNRPRRRTTRHMTSSSGRRRRRAGQTGDQSHSGRGRA